MNVLNMGFMDENLPKIHALAASGKIRFVHLYGRLIREYSSPMRTFPITDPCTGKPEGFGLGQHMVDIDKYHKLSEEKVKDIQHKVERCRNRASSSCSYRSSSSLSSP
jgi:hypothetical protein